MNIVIVNYGMGNIGSILSMFTYLKIEAYVSDKPEEIEKAKKIVLPGVGAFDNGINSLKELGLIDILNNKVLNDNTPILGICLGMQLMTLSSEEGVLDGLGWIKAKTTRFLFNGQRNLKVPHMGWNFAHKITDNPIIKGLSDLPKFYFTHSYYVTCSEPDNSICKTNYGVEFDSVISKNNIFGCQFHPEKSHKYGMKILENFNSL